MEKIEIKELGKHVDALSDIRYNWMLVTADKDGKYNTLTASWGGLGCIWRRDVAFIFIRPSRHTYEFLKSGKFSLTFFNGHMDELGYLGKTSGRDVPDKAEKVGLTPVSVDGITTFKEGRLVINCKTLYQDVLDRENFIDPALDDEMNPGNENRSVMFIGEIESAYLL